MALLLAMLISKSGRWLCAVAYFSGCYRAIRCLLPARRKSRASQPMRMASTGQGATQAPQPVHSSGSTSGCAASITCGRKRMASTGQASPQARQTTCCLARQVSKICALICQGATASSSRRNACGSQASTHLPQKVQAFTAKLMVGRPSASSTMMRSGQARQQSPQRVQASTNAGSAKAQGGRGMLALRATNLPRRKSRRLTISGIRGQVSGISKNIARLLLISCARFLNLAPCLLDAGGEHFGVVGIGRELLL